MQRVGWLLLALLTGCSDGCGRIAPHAEREPSHEPLSGPKRPDPSEQPTVVVIVMDTVRADHTSLCGYERPTTPFLQTLGQRAGPVSYTCEAYSPGTWTIPSHASFFTGVPVPVHTADSAGIALPEELPTLAEVMGQRGYQRLLFSANPTLSKRSGLQRGFDFVRIAKDLEAWRGPDIAPVLRSTLANLDKDRPLLAIVNLIDAHDPYPEIPIDVGWVPPHDAFPIEPQDEGGQTPFHRFVRGELSDEASKELIAHATDTYDYGVRRADDNVQVVIATLRATGWLQGPFRIIITSDHGEFLGEHKLLRHGCYPWEPVVKVPLMYYEPGRSDPIDLSGPMSGTDVFWLASEGRRGPPADVLATSRHRRDDARGCADMVALWPDAKDKLIWKHGEIGRVDLAVTPLVEVVLPLEDAEARATIEHWGKVHADHLQVQRAQGVDADRIEELRGLGYVE